MESQRHVFALLSLSAATTIGAALLAAPLAHAGPGSVHQSGRFNDTGLTRCTRDFMTFTTNCADTGQDAEFGRDVGNSGNANGHAGFAFQKVCNSGEFAGMGNCSPLAVLGAGPDDWACTFDRVTGLEWEVKTADGGLRDQRKHYTNEGDGGSGDTSTYVAAVNAQALCGAGDWRLPTSGELQGIVDFDRGSPRAAIDTAWFPNSPKARWWSSEASFGLETTSAWTVSTVMDFRRYGVLEVQRSSHLNVRLVRTPQSHAVVEDARFVAGASGDEMVDSITKLVWKRCVEGMNWNHGTCSGSPKTYVFSDALEHANRVAARTGKAWRLPNAKELNGITLKTTANPATDTTLFPNTPPGFHWTSTIWATSPNYAWIVDFSLGDVFAGGELGTEYVRLVRDAD